MLRSIPFNSQFEILYDSVNKIYLKFTEDIGMKTNKGSLKHHKMDCKIVDVYQSDNPERCPVAILLKYLSLLSKNRVCKALYLQPRKKFSAEVWYLDRPVGVNTLRYTVREICDKAGFPGFFSNHSLRSSSATRMYRGCP